MAIFFRCDFYMDVFWIINNSLCSVPALLYLTYDSLKRRRSFLLTGRQIQSQLLTNVEFDGGLIGGLVTNAVYWIRGE